MSNLERILENNLETMKSLIEASKSHSDAINLLSKRITTIETEKTELATRVKKLENDKKLCQESMRRGVSGS
jgi:prefoldin subunit 5